jgi:DNA helicase HerA-like ATPase
MSRLFTPAQIPLTLPGSGRRTLRRPDARHLIVPRLSAAPLSSNEIDFDDLVIHRSYREYDPTMPGEVRYMMYELSQLPAGAAEYTNYFKAVRMVRVTRVPRYLRISSNSGPNMVFEQQRDILAALREKQVLFLNVIAKSQSLPMIFAYGVQGVGATPEEAKKMADEGWAVLREQLHGQFQQLQFQQLTVDQAESLVRYQNEWNQIAMARGRPVPAGGNFGMGNFVDGNRTEVESSLNQLESFMRGMVDREFILSLVSVPVSPQDMMLAWRNISGKLSQIRSEQQGTRAFSAGVAIPMAMGQSLGSSAGAGHALAASENTSVAAGVNHSLATGVNHTATDGITKSSSVSDSTGLATTTGHTLGTNHSTGTSTTDTAGTNSSTSQSTTAGTTEGTSSSTNQSTGTSVSDSSSTAVTHGVTNTTGTNHSGTTGTSASDTSGTSSSASSGDSTGSSVSSGASAGSNSGVHGGLAGIVGGSKGDSAGSNSGVAASSGTSASDTAGTNASTTAGTNASTTDGTSASHAVSTSTTDTSGVTTGTTDTSGTSEGTSSGTFNSTTNGTTEGVSNSVAQGVSATDGTSAAVSTTAGASKGVADTSGVASSTAQSLGTSSTNTDGTSTTDTTGSALSNGLNTSFATSSALSGSLALVPNASMVVSRNVYDESKRILGDVIEAQMKRYVQGVESGAFFYQMFLTCPDRESLLGAAGLLKSAFWGAGTADDRLPQPFHTITEFDDAEAARLLLHGRAFTQYRKREAVMEVVEQHHFSSYITPAEMAAFCHPPTAEMPGIKAMVDSMPVLAIPYDRQSKDIHLGRVINGERAEVSNIEFGLDVDEITHTLIAGTTGIGKTTTLLTMLAEISRVKRQIIEPATVVNPVPGTREVRAGILGLDWANNMRNLASVVDHDRFRFYSIASPELGAFRWNPLAVPDDGMNPVEWAGDLADNMTISFNLGEFGRSLIAEILSDLYSANRLEDFVLRPEVRDANTHQVLREGIILARLSRAELPAEAIEIGVDGTEVANVLTYPALSRLISMSHLATLVLAKVEEAATIEGARLHGPAFRDRIQSLWRRVSYFAPGSMFANVFACDEHLDERTTLGVRDLVDPERGLVTIIEAEGMDLTNRRFVLGSVLLAVWRYGQHHGQGCFDQNGAGPGTFVCLEEAHELFGDQGRDEDAFSAATRTSLYESMFRRARSLGMKLVAVVQNCGAIPSAVTSNTTTVMIHRQYDDNDRKRAFSLLNWDHMINAQQREWRYLGEMPRGYLIIRLDAKNSYLESTPYQIMVDPAAIAAVSDAELLARAGSLVHH